ncbi:putative tryparedoxin 2 [Trypanosoma cruzi]|uniref:Tryparedoxin n=1 Tax=Trypanosoma cruzi TaxID=5693 RepID=Q9U8B3_TRYCR|nr:tryparedoxin [Trypanosoma cruzi]PWV12862.1 putative tryparedoxin 2 [Trypanosoma cruzi]RNC37562.1 tryparedoxin [Trypanosoma cruzi]
MLPRVLGAGTLELLRQDGSNVTASKALQGKKYLLVYLSASWCPPCRFFTPKLAAFYESFHNSHNFEIVFVSQDRDERSMQAYFHNQKYSKLAVRGGEGSHGDWLAVPYEQAKRLGVTLMQTYAIRGIPMLLLFDLETGELVTRNARDLVARNLDTAEGFPWAGNTDGEGLRGSYWNQLFLVFIIASVLYQFWR